MAGPQIQHKDLTGPDLHPPGPHTHVEADITNLDKYTQEQTNALLDNLLAEVATGYYSQAQTNTLLATKSNVGHTHVSSSITDFSAASDARISAQKGVASGLATLDTNGKIPSAQLPSIALTTTFVVGSQAAMLALGAVVGNIAVRTDLNKTYILAGSDPTILGNWQELLAAGNLITSVNGQIGSVVLTTSDITEGSHLYYTDSRVQSFGDSRYLQSANNLSDIGSASTARINLGLGSMATQSSGAVAVTGGSITGITDIAVADGGTGASTTSQARINLGVQIGADVQAYDATLAALSGFNANGLLTQTAADTFIARSLAAGSSKISLANANGISGNPTIDITEANINLANLGGTLGIAQGGTNAVTAANARSNLGAVSIIGDTMTGPLQFNGTTNAGIIANSLTTTQRNALTAVNGNILYNSTISQMQVYSNGQWTDISKNPATVLIASASSGYSADYYTTGTGDQSIINSAITQVSVLGGGIVKLMPGCTFTTSDSIIQKSKVYLDAYGAIINLTSGSNKTMLQDDDHKNSSGAVDHITVRGGIWNAGTLTAGGNFPLMLLGGSNLDVRDLEFSSSGTQSFSLIIHNATDFNVENIYFNNVTSDGFHISGPCARGTVKNIGGDTFDDLVLLNNNDTNLPSSGDITDITIDGIKPVNFSRANVFKILSGKNGSTVLNTQRIHVKNVTGVLATGFQSGIYIGDDPNFTGTKDGQLDFITIENVSLTTPNSNTTRPIFYFKGSSTSLTIPNIKISNVDVIGDASSVLQVEQAKITNLEINNVSGKTSTGGMTGIIYYAGGTSGSVITNLALNNINITQAGSTSGDLINNITAGDTLTNVYLSNVYLSNFSKLTDTSVSSNYYFSNVRMVSNGEIFHIRSGANIVVQTCNGIYGDNISSSIISTGTLESKSSLFPMNAGDAQAVFNTGDSAYNNTNANSNLIGAYFKNLTVANQLNINTSGSTTGVQLTDTGANGANIKMIGNSSGVKYIRTRNNIFQILDSGYSNALLNVTEAGKFGGLNVTNPTAYMHLTAGTASANTAPLKFTSGTNLTSPEAGVMEFDGSSFYLTAVSTRKTIGYTDMSNLVPVVSFSMNSQKITNLLDPASAQDAATKNYVDTVAQGLSPKPSAVVATTAGLPTYTYLSGVITATATGTLIIDGHTVALNEYVLVKDETSTNAPYNGLYKCTTAGAGGVAYILTRALEMDAANEFVGSFVFIESGTVNSSSGWVCTDTGAIVVGTTNIAFTQFSGAGEITAGTGITKTGNTLSIGQAVGTGSSVTFSAVTTSGLTSSDIVIVSATGAASLAVGRNGTTNPVLQVDASTTSAVTGLLIKGAVATGGVALSAISSGTNENLTLDAKGTGTISLGSVSTGNIIISTLQLTNALAVGYGGTGQTSYTDGQLLIGNTTGNTLAKATLTAGNSITVTNGHGAITLDTIQDIRTSASPTFVALTLSGASVFTSAAAANVVPLTINQNDTTNNPVGLLIANTGSGASLSITAPNIAKNVANGMVKIMSTDSEAADIGGSIGLGGYITGTSVSQVHGQIAARKENGTSANTRAYMQFSLTQAERMRIDSNGRLGFGGAGPVATNLYTYDLAWVTTTAKTIGMERMTTAATAGTSLTISSQGAVSGGTNLAGGNLILQPGIPTGTAYSSLQLRSYSPVNASGAPLASGSTDGQLLDRMIINGFKALTNNSAINLVNCTLASNTLVGGIIRYAIEVFDSTNLQMEVGEIMFSSVNKGGVFSLNTMTQIGSAKQTLGSGTLTVTWAISAASPAVISINANSSLTPATGYPRITYTIENFTQQAIAIQ